MAPHKKGPSKVAANPPVRVPTKMGTQGPESGPSGDVVVEASAPGASATIPDVPSDPKEAKAQEKAQAVAENSESARTVKVQANEKGFIGNRVRDAGDVFFLALKEGEELPSWVTAVASEDVPTTPLSHSSEAREEVVDAAGIGHTAQSTLKGK